MLVLDSIEQQRNVGPLDVDEWPVAPDRKNVLLDLTP
jgi:hypothetical protein